MKTISELQQSVEQLTKGLKVLSADLCEMEQSKDTGVINYDEVEMQAKVRLFNEHPLAKYNHTIKANYLRLLFSVMYYENKHPMNGLAYIYKIAYSAKYNDDVRLLYEKGLNIPVKELDELVSSLRGVSNDSGLLAEMLAFEMVVLAKKYVEEKAQASKYLAKLFALLDMDEEQIRFVLNLAGAVMSEDARRYSSTRNFLDEQFQCYIDDSKALKAQIEGMRSVYYMRQGRRLGFTSGFQGNSFYEYVGCKAEGNLVAVAYNTRMQDYGLKPDFDGAVAFTTKLNKDGAMFENVPNNDIEKREYAYTAKIGYYHSPMDTKSSAEEWYKNQAEGDPKYGEIQDWLNLENIAKRDKWELETDWKYGHINNFDNLSVWLSSVLERKIAEGDGENGNS
jgi:hypothetical protein